MRANRWAVISDSLPLNGTSHPLAFVHIKYSNRKHVNLDSWDAGLRIALERVLSIPYFEALMRPFGNMKWDRLNRMNPIRIPQWNIPIRISMTVTLN
jgi:hypothetical protein